jgi:hypothetical protein
MKNLLREVLLLSIVMTLVSGLMASLAQAASAPRSLTLSQSDSSVKALGGVCYTTDVGAQALPCNPAFIARDSKPDFRAQFFTGNNISYLQDVSDLLSGDGDAATVNSLFSQTRASEMEANIEGGYRRPTFGIALSPYRVLYYSLIRNRSLPVITLLASQEQTLRSQFGGYAGNDWSWGVQLRGVHRKVIAKTFTLTDALSESGRVGLFDAENQNAIYVEPGFLKEWTEEPWRPQFTLAIAQLGYVDRKIEDFPTSPELHIGTAVHPPVGLGIWEIGLDAALDSKTESLQDPFRLGSSYEIGVTRLSGSFSRSDHALGFQLKYRDLSGGLTYTSRWIENWLGEDEWVRTVYLQFGFDL